MHMADALINPEVGAVLWLGAAGLIGHSIKKIKEDEPRDSSSFIPLTGVSAAFVFAAQMINFAIPGTGASGHIGGGILLSLILGPYGAILAMSVILAIQALFFADGGVLALGANIINMGFFSCFVAYPLLLKNRKQGKNTSLFIVLATILGLQLGSFSLVVETSLSGRTNLPFGHFLFLMQPIHLAIGLVEGLITAASISYIRSHAPQFLFESREDSIQTKKTSFKPILLFLGVALLVGVIFSSFASSSPDGLEWSMEKVGFNEDDQNLNSKVYEIANTIQNKLAFLPDYSLKNSEEQGSLDTPIAGFVGIVITLLIMTFLGLIFRKFYNKRISIE